MSSANSVMAVGIGAASNARSITPHGLKDPLDFISDFVLGSRHPNMAMNLVMFSIVKQTRRTSIAEFTVNKDDTTSEEQQRLEFDVYKALSVEFLHKLKETYPEPEEDEKNEG